MMWLTRNHDRDVYRVCTNCGLPRPSVNEYADDSLRVAPLRHCWSHSASMCRNMGANIEQFWRLSYAMA